METKNHQLALTSLPLPRQVFSLILEANQGHLSWSNLALGITAIVAFVVHSYNMFGYPLYYSDEGIYMEQAYAVAKLGRLAIYTYFYDHAPVAWLQLAAWSTLTGGFHAFGTPIDSGRVFILLLHVATVILLFRITLQLTANTFVAIITAMLFTLSPLSVHFGRQVLLDNIMGFWVVLAMALLLNYNGNILRLLFSGFCFGIAVLSKENAILLLPGFIYGLWMTVKKDHARFARTAWLFGAIATISSYFLFAILKSELLPSSDRVSLIGAIVWQSSRKGGLPWEQTSDFYKMLINEWCGRDIWLVLLGAIASLWNLLNRDSTRRFLGLLLLLMVLSIARGGQVYNFYVAAMLPLLAINAGIAINDCASRMKTPAMLPISLAIVATVSLTNLEGQQFLFNLDATKMQRQVVAWVEENLPADSFILIEDNLWLDLQLSDRGEPAFANAHSHWKAARDPAVYHEMLHDNWRNIDYLIVDTLMPGQFAKERDKLPYNAYINSTAIARFEVNTFWAIESLEIRRVNDVSAM